MVKIWGKKAEYTFYAYVNCNVWALPVRLAVDRTEDILGNKHSAISLEIFCFGFELERWIWKGEQNDN